MLPKRASKLLPVAAVEQQRNPNKLICTRCTYVCMCLNVCAWTGDRGIEIVLHQKSWCDLAIALSERECDTSNNSLRIRVLLSVTTGRTLSFVRIRRPRLLLALVVRVRNLIVLTVSFLILRHPAASCGALSLVPICADQETIFQMPQWHLGRTFTPIKRRAGIQIFGRRLIHIGACHKPKAIIVCTWVILVHPQFWQTAKILLLRNVRSGRVMTIPPQVQRAISRLCGICAHLCPHSPHPGKMPRGLPLFKTLCPRSADGNLSGYDFFLFVFDYGGILRFSVLLKITVTVLIWLNSFNWARLHDSWTFLFYLLIQMKGIIMVLFNWNIWVLRTARACGCRLQYSSYLHTFTHTFWADLLT